MDDGADRDARAIGGAAAVVQADVIELGANREVRQNSEVNAATDAIGEVVGGAASYGQMCATREELNERRDFGWVMHVDARAEHISVGVEGDAAGRGVVAAEIADETQIVVGVVGEGAAKAVLVDVGAASEAEIRVADGGVDGLCARRNGENEQRQAK